jgi:arginine exporter protein ArgO
MASLLKSRKFWLAVVGVAQTVVLHYFQVPQDIWIAINVLIGVVIAGIAVEDAAEKSARIYYVEDVEE